MKELRILEDYLDNTPRKEFILKDWMKKFKAIRETIPNEEVVWVIIKVFYKCRLTLKELFKAIGFSNKDENFIKKIEAHFKTSEENRID